MFKNYCNQIINIYTEIKYNNKNVLNTKWCINAEFDQICGMYKFYIILPSDPDIQLIDSRDNWTLDEWTENALDDIDNFGTYSIIQNLLKLFKTKFEYLSNCNINELINLSAYLLVILNKIDKIICYELNKVEMCCNQLDTSKKLILDQLEVVNNHMRVQRDIVCKSLEDELCDIVDQICYCSILINSNCINI